MPEPIKSGRRYMPGIDGLRAVAVLGVIAYHVGVPVVPGGLLGVSVFFTLSGYLITDLLLGQVDGGGVSFPAFWRARARRLLPALFTMLMVVTAWVTLIGPHQGDSYRLAAGSAVLYVNNWWAVLRDVSYFAQFQSPGPLNHLWSLAVEEQFYVVWPVLLIAGTRLVKDRGVGLTRPRLGLVIMGGAVASVIAMALLYKPGADPSRVYYGTDTRAAELLLGAALATVWPSQRLSERISTQARLVIDAVGVVGLLVIAAMFAKTSELSPFLYRGGFLLLSIGAAAVVASVAHPASRLGPILGCAPMRWVGTRSYGIYLWHVPIIVLTTPDGPGRPGPIRSTLQVAASLGVAAVSWRFVEDPIRHGAIGRWWARAKSGEWRPASLLTPARAGVVALGALILVPAVAGFAGANTVDDDAPTDKAIAVTESVTAAPPSGPAAPSRTSTSCTSVVHVGDSTSLSLVSPVYIENEAERASAQYTRVGATTQHFEIQGGRAIVEGYKDAPNAQKSAKTWRDQGYKGCWVMALGTMDAANVGVGGRPGMSGRIDLMMAIAAGDPVLWINVKTIATRGSWRTEVMPPWNEALVAACERYPNLRIYDWASDVQDDWFEKDGIHQNRPGSVVRARNIADALAKAYPTSSAPAPGCLVTS